jgi:hypothetical protein
MRLPIYLVDFSCFKAPDELRVNFDDVQTAAWNWKVRCSGVNGLSQANLHLSNEGI